MMHEALTSLFRDNPHLVTQLLGERLPMPERPMLALEDTAFADITPVDYRADAVIRIDDGQGGLACALIIEVQLGQDPGKRYSWPRYIAALRHQLRCDVDLAIIAPDRAVSVWCAQPIVMGHQGFVLKPWVVGPREIPRITDVDVLAATPELGVLSMAAHGHEPGAEYIAEAAMIAMSQLEDRRSSFYMDLVYSFMSPVAQTALEIMMQARKYEYQSAFARKYFSAGQAEGEAKGKAEGKLKGKAEGLLLALEIKGFTVSEELRASIERCTDPSAFERWYERIRTADRLTDVFDTQP